MGPEHHPLIVSFVSSVLLAASSDCMYVCVGVLVMGGDIPVTVCYRCAMSTVLLVPLCYVTERLDPWCSGLPLQEVSDVSEMSHQGAR